MKSKKNRVNRIVNVAIVALLCYVAASLFMLQLDILSYRKQLDSLKSQCQEQLLENQEMDALLQNGTDYEYIVRMAREKLGLAFPDEKIFYDASGNQ